MVYGVNRRKEVWFEFKNRSWFIRKLIKRHRTKGKRKVFSCKTLFSQVLATSTKYSVATSTVSSLIVCGFIQSAHFTTVDAT